MSKLSRGQKGEELVIKTLGKSKDYFKLLNNVTLINKNSEMSHQIDHIYIHPHGIFIIETKNYYGEILINNGIYYRKIDNKLEKIPNPLLQNKSHAVTLNKLIKRKEIIVPVVVYVKNNAPYADNENVINLADLHLFIDSYPYIKELSNAEIDAIYELIKQNSMQISNKEHLENIGFLKAVNKELRKEKEYAITKGICPRCEHKMIIKGNHFTCSNCGYKFSL